MNTRERFRAVMRGQTVDRLPAIESYWWWDLTLNRWHGEGLPAELSAHPDVARHLGLDTHYIFWVTPRTRFFPPAGCTREEGYVRNEADYDRLIAPVFEAISYDTDELRRYADLQLAGDAFIWLQIDGFFWFPRELMGIERHLLAFYDEPELMHRMNQDLSEWTLRFLQTLYEICEPDVVSFAEDMSYNKGPMLSQNCFETFLAPYYCRIVPTLTNHDATIIVDSDGDVTEMIPWLQSVGIQGASPLERRAGVDITAIRQQYPDFRMLGAFDKTVMHLGEAAIRAEFERILPVLRSGYCVPSVDHQTPPEVSLDDYRTYVALLHEYCRCAVE